MEEFRALCDAELPVWERRSRSDDNDARQRRRYHKQGVPYHVMRLFDTMKGFHEVCISIYVDFLRYLIAILGLA